MGETSCLKDLIKERVLFGPFRKEEEIPYAVSSTMNRVFARVEQLGASPRVAALWRLLWEAHKETHMRGRIPFLGAVRRRVNWEIRDASSSSMDDRVRKRRRLMYQCHYRDHFTSLMRSLRLNFATSDWLRIGSGGGMCKSPDGSSFTLYWGEKDSYSSHLFHTLFHTLFDSFLPCQDNVEEQQ